MPFDQRVKGIELGSGVCHGHLGARRELHAPESQDTATNDPEALGEVVPNAPHDALTSEDGGAHCGLDLGGGSTAVVIATRTPTIPLAYPATVVFNVMASYEFNAHFKLQLNLNNVTDKPHFTSIYYVDVAENHACPPRGDLYRHCELSLLTTGHGRHLHHFVAGPIEHARLRALFAQGHERAADWCSLPPSKDCRSASLLRAAAAGRDRG